MFHFCHFPWAWSSLSALQLLWLNSHLNLGVVLLAVPESTQAPDKAQAVSGSLRVDGPSATTSYCTMRGHKDQPHLSRGAKSKGISRGPGARSLQKGLGM